MVENELLVLLVILFLGLAIDQIKIFGFKLGMAVTLFVGFILATMEPEVQISPLTYIVGLVLFVYTIGLEANPELLSSLRSRGIRYNLFGIGALAVTAIESFLLIKLLPIDPVEGAGTFTGALTNTPAMAATVNVLPSLISDKDKLTVAYDIPVVGYSLTYPIGVLTAIVSVGITSKAFRVGHNQGAIDADIVALPLHIRDTKVLKEGLPSITDLPSKFGLDITVSHVEYRGRLYIPSPGNAVSVGDIVFVAGTEGEIVRAFEYVGELMSGDPTHNSRLDFRRIFVFVSDVVGVPITEPQTRMDGTIIIRVRRGDHDIVVEPNTRLELGDRVRVVVTPEKIRNATKFFGGSYKKFSDIDLLPLTPGLTLGVLVGLIKIPFPGGSSFILGSTGGSLVVALILGVVGRTGPLVWPVLYLVNLTLRTMGLVPFLAGIGTTAGKGFQATLSDPVSLAVLGLVAITALNFTLLTLAVGHRVLKIPFGQTVGILPDLQTHPVVLSYVNDQAKNGLSAMGYTTVCPMVMIIKITLAQVLVVLALWHSFVAAFSIIEALAETAVNPE